MMERRTCAVDGCDRVVDSRGWCQMHWKRWRRWGDPTHVKRPQVAAALTCSIDGCECPPHAKGLCRPHYNRHRYVGGSPEHREPVLPQPDRFLSYVDKGREDGCWIWTAYVDADGYGRLTVAHSDGSRRPLGAHRISHVLFKGPIPEGLEIDHLCRVRNCVNPQHLEPVTTQENTRRRVSYSGPTWMASRNTCKNGHPFEGDNLHIRPDGSRGCRACKRAYYHAAKERSRSAS